MKQRAQHAGLRLLLRDIGQHATRQIRRRLGVGQAPQQRDEPRELLPRLRISIGAVLAEQLEHPGFERLRVVEAGVGQGCSPVARYLHELFQSLAQSEPGAVNPRLHRAFGDLENLCDVLVGLALDVVEDDRNAQLRGQLLQRFLNAPLDLRAVRRVFGVARRGVDRRARRLARARAPISRARARPRLRRRFSAALAATR